MFGRLSYLSGSGSWSRAAPLLELGLATRDSSLRVLRVWVTLYLPICALVWILIYFGDCHRVWSLEDDSIVLHFYSLICYSEVGFEFLLREKKRQVLYQRGIIIAKLKMMLTLTERLQAISVLLRVKGTSRRMVRSINFLGLSSMSLTCRRLVFGAMMRPRREQRRQKAAITLLLPLHP